MFTNLTTWALNRFDFSSSSSTYRTYYLLGLETLDPKIRRVNCLFKSMWLPHISLYVNDSFIMCVFWGISPRRTTLGHYVRGRSSCVPLEEGKLQAIYLHMWGFPYLWVLLRFRNTFRWASLRRTHLCGNLPYNKIVYQSCLLVDAGESLRECQIGYLCSHSWWVPSLEILPRYFSAFPSTQFHTNSSNFLTFFFFPSVNLTFNVVKFLEGIAKFLISQTWKENPD